MKVTWWIIVGLISGIALTAMIKGDRLMNNQHTETALFAGGCFWCMQPPYDTLDGVLSTEVGFSGGSVVNPSYSDVVSGKTGHRETVRIVFDPKKISYDTLLEVFWSNIDPTADYGQFADVGPHYRTAIFYMSDDQRLRAEKSKKTLDTSERFDGDVMTEILPATPFYTAEEYHQGYYKKNPLRYKLYKKASGRDAFIKKHQVK